MFADSFIFEQLIYCPFCSKGGGKRIGHFFVDVLFLSMTLNLSGCMNLAATQNSRDHDPGHPNIQNKELLSF